MNTSKKYFLLSILNGMNEFIFSTKLVI